jgi:hypothetical protein
VPTAALGLVAGEELEEPGLTYAVLGGDIADGWVLDHHGGDQQSVQCHIRTLEPGRRPTGWVPRTRSVTATPTTAVKKCT